MYLEPQIFKGKAVLKISQKKKKKKKKKNEDRVFVKFQV